MKPLVMEIKALLSDFLISDDVKLRRKFLEDAQELFNQLEMDENGILKALKAEVDGKKEMANKRVEGLLEEIDELEYED